MIWYLFARWPDLAAAVVALVVGAFLISLGLLFLVVSFLTSSNQGLIPGAIAMVVVGAALMAIVGVRTLRPLQSHRVRPPQSG
jgi:peptidoglycan/LPS O-acetylase OafA/YrhL